MRLQTRLKHYLKGSALPADPKMKKQMKTMNIYKNENLQKLIILEGFMQHGLQNRNQRIFLRKKTCVKIDFRHCFEQLRVLTLKCL